MVLDAPGGRYSAGALAMLVNVIPAGRFPQRVRYAADDLRLGVGVLWQWFYNPAFGIITYAANGVGLARPALAQRSRAG